MSICEGNGQSKGPLHCLQHNIGNHAEPPQPNIFVKFANDPDGQAQEVLTEKNTPLPPKFSQTISEQRKFQPITMAKVTIGNSEGSFEIDFELDSCFHATRDKKRKIVSEHFSHGIKEFCEGVASVPFKDRTARSRQLAAAFAMAVTASTAKGQGWIARRGEESIYKTVERIFPEVTRTCRPFEYLDKNSCRQQPAKKYKDYHTGS